MKVCATTVGDLFFPSLFLEELILHQFIDKSSIFFYRVIEWAVQFNKVLGMEFPLGPSNCKVLHCAQFSCVGYFPTNRRDPFSLFSAAPCLVSFIDAY